MLKKELQPPKIDENKLTQVENILKEINMILDDYILDIVDNEIVFENEEIEKTILERKTELEKIINSKVTLLELNSYKSACDIRDTAIDLLLYNVPYVPEITLEELTELINEFEELNQIEPEYENYYLRLLEKSFDMNVTDYIFWPNTKGMQLDAEPFEIAQKIIEDSKIKKLRL